LDGEHGIVQSCRFYTIMVFFWSAKVVNLYLEYNNE